MQGTGLQKKDQEKKWAEVKKQVLSQKPMAYDDNFGWWNIESIEDLDFYHDVQRQSVEKRCRRCDRLVRILPHYDICGTCADHIEKGY